MHASLDRRSITNMVAFESLEQRLNLAGDCVLESSDESEVGRAVEAVNCFAVDLYEHVQNEQGNLFLSPASIATSLAMAYAGAAGTTAEEMERVLHLGSQPGIHSSYNALLGSLTHPVEHSNDFELVLANALWPQTGLHLRDQFIRTGTNGLSG